MLFKCCILRKSQQDSKLSHGCNCKIQFKIKRIILVFCQSLSQLHKTHLKCLKILDFGLHIMHIIGLLWYQIDSPGSQTKPRCIIIMLQLYQLVIMQDYRTTKFSIATSRCLHSVHIVITSEASENFCKKYNNHTDVSFRQHLGRWGQGGYTPLHP